MENTNAQNAEQIASKMIMESGSDMTMSDNITFPSVNGVLFELEEMAFGYIDYLRELRRGRGSDGSDIVGELMIMLASQTHRLISLMEILDDEGGTSKIIPREHINLLAHTLKDIERCYYPSWCK